MKSRKPLKRQPKTTHALATREAILQAAAHIAAIEGTDKLNTNFIAEKAGVSVGSLYQYFTDKDEILFELFTGVLNRRLLRFKSAVEIQHLLESKEELISRVVEAMFHYESEQEAMLEAALIPLAMTRFKKQNVSEHFKKSDQLLKPVIKGILLLKKPDLLMRNLDVLIFIMVQSIRGCLLGLYLPTGKGLDREEVKAEIKNLIVGFLN